jgi:hypothetical protein
MLAGIEAEQPLTIAVNDGPCCHHLGVKQRPARQQPMEHPAVTVSPIHHRRDGERIQLIYLHFSIAFNLLYRVMCTLFYAIVRCFF